MTNFMMVYISMSEYFGGKSIPQRYILAGLSFAAAMCMYMIRVCLAISMTQMVRSVAINASSSHGDGVTCPMPATIHHSASNQSMHSIESDLHMFDWSQEQQGYILSAFYIGYVIAHFPGGLLAERIGGKPVILMSLFTSALLTILTPAAVVYGGVSALFIVRVLLGVVQAGMYPAVATLLAVWIPQRERARVGSIVYCSGPFGAVLGNSAAGYLIYSYQSWQVSFYTFGAIGIIIGFLYTVLCSSDPSTHPTITEAEKEYLQREVGQLEREKNLKAVPWREMCTSKPVIALFLTLVVGDWAYYSILVDLPKYMNDVLHVSIKNNGVLTALPWAMFMLVSVTAGFFSDRLIAQGRLSVTNTRKLLVTISCTVGGIFIVAAAYAGCDITIVGLFFTIAVGAQGLNSASLSLNAMDIAPNYAGMLVGIIGTFSCCMGIVVPVAISYLTPNSLQSEWRNVFWITFVVSAAKIVIFDTMASAKVQPWNSQQKPNDVESKTNPDEAS